MMKFSCVVIISLLLNFILSACSDERQLRELKNDIAKRKEKAAHTTIKKDTTEFILPEPAKYGLAASPKINAPQSQNVVKNPLNEYPIQALQFVGTVVQNKQILAYLMTPAATIYPVKEGDIIGDSYGKIIKIDSEHIEVLQKNTVPGNKALKQQIITLKLKE